MNDFLTNLKFYVLFCVKIVLNFYILIINDHLFARMMLQKNLLVVPKALHHAFVELFRRVSVEFSNCILKAFIAFISDCKRLPVGAGSAKFV